MSLLRALGPPDGATHPNAARWHAHMLGLSAYKLANLPGAVTSLAPPAPSTPAPSTPAPSTALAAGGTCAPCGPGGSSAIAGGFAWSSEPVCRGQHPKWTPPPASQGQVRARARARVRVRGRVRVRVRVRIRTLTLALALTLTLASA